jgi:hypothetical protein
METTNVYQAHIKASQEIEAKMKTKVKVRNA